MTRIEQALNKCLLLGSHEGSYMCAQACPSPSDSMDCSPQGSSVHEISQAILRLPLPPPGHLPDSDQIHVSSLLHGQANSLQPSHLGNPKWKGQMGTTQSLLGSDDLYLSPEWRCLHFPLSQSQQQKNKNLFWSFFQSCSRRLLWPRGMKETPPPPPPFQNFLSCLVVDFKHFTSRLPLSHHLVFVAKEVTHLQRKWLSKSRDLGQGAWFFKALVFWELKKSVRWRVCSCVFSFSQDWCTISCFCILKTAKLLVNKWPREGGAGAAREGCEPRGVGKGCSFLGPGRTSVKVQTFFSFNGGAVETGGRVSESRLEAGGWSGKEKKKQVRAGILMGVQIPKRQLKLTVCW